MNHRLRKKAIDKDELIHGLQVSNIAMTAQNDQLKELVELLMKEHEAFNPYALKVPTCPN